MTVMRRVFSRLRDLQVLKYRSGASGALLLPTDGGDGNGNVESAFARVSLG